MDMVTDMRRSMGVIRKSTIRVWHVIADEAEYNSWRIFCFIIHFSTKIAKEGDRKMKKLKRLVAVCMMMVMMVPVTAFASEATPGSATPDSASPEKINLAEVTVTAQSVVFNRQEQTAKIYADGVLLEQGVDYAEAVVMTNAQAKTFTITGIGNYEGTAQVVYEIKPLNLKSAAAQTELAVKTMAYTGRLQTGTIFLTVLGSKVSAANYTAKGNSRKVAGKSSVAVTGQGNYKGTVTAHYQVNKAAQPMMLYTEDARKVDASKGDVTINCVVSRVREEADLTWSSDCSTIKVSSTGTVTVLKGTAPGKYKVKVLAASTANYKATSKTMTIVVK